MWFNIVDNKIDCEYEKLPYTHKNINVGELSSEELAKHGWIEYTPTLVATQHPNPRFKNVHVFEYDPSTKRIVDKIKEVELIPVPPLDDFIRIKKQEVNSYTNNIIQSMPDYELTSGTTSTIQLYQNSLNYIALLTSIAALNAESTFVFRDYENVNHTITADQVIKLSTDVKNYIQSVRMISWQLKDAIESKTDVDDLYSFDVPTQWSVLKNSLTNSE